MNNNIEAEPIGWISLEEAVYLHVADDNAADVLVLGLPQMGNTVFMVV